MENNKSTKPFYNSPILGDWDPKHFGDIAEIDSECLNGNTSKDYEFDYISLSDVDSEDFRIETTRQVFGTAPSRARRIVKKGDILMSTVRPNLQGFSIIRNDVKDFIASTGFAVITCQKCSNEFLFQYLFSSSITKQFYQLIVGSNYPAINSSDVKRLKIYLPPLREQRVIAHVLRTMDEVISKTNQLIAQKELRKNWFEQQLLTGKKRLSGFENTQWHLKSLEEVAEFKNGKAHENSIAKNGKYIVVNSKFISTEGKVIKKSNENLCPLFIDDIVLVMSDIPNGKALVKCFYINENNRYTLNQRICSIRANNETDSRFLFFLLNRNPHYLTFNNGVGQTNLKKEEVLECPLLMPDKEEQTAIAQVLQTADKEIQLLKTKAEKLKEQKKGLMQVLLTGKKRLKI